MKKGEAQIQESIIVIFIFMIIFAIALFGVQRYNVSSVENIKGEIIEAETLNLLRNLPNSPLIQYSELGDEKELVDTLKLLNLELENFGDRTISFKQTYPEVQELECSNENYPECSNYVIYNRQKTGGNVESVSIPVSLYFPLTKETKLGVLNVITYG